MTFQSTGLSKTTLQTLSDAGYNEATPVQAQTIPLVLHQKDVLVSAQTGTGKTASFVAPLIDILVREKPGSNKVAALILVPTRELAVQIQQSIQRYSVNSALRTTAVYGGVKINPQMMALRRGVHFLVATPGRLLDLHSQNAVKFDDLKVLVLDEADRMLSLGFSKEMEQLLKLLPRKRQTLMFSATISDDVRRLADQLLDQPVEVTVSPKQVTAVKINQWLVPVDKAQKTALLIALFSQKAWAQLLVFVKTKQGADKLAKELAAANISCGVIHGDKSQSVRLRNVEQFKSGETKLLIATDLASRGLDIGALPAVINFDLPKVAEDYVHRIGRTGRANHDGEAVSLVSADEFDNLRKIEQLIQQVIRREYVEGFRPDHDLQQATDVPVPAKPKKPKKRKLIKG